MKGLIVMTLLILAGCSTSRMPCRRPLQPINTTPPGSVASHPAESR